MEGSLTKGLTLDRHSLTTAVGVFHSPLSEFSAGPPGVWRSSVAEYKVVPAYAPNAYRTARRATRSRTIGGRGCVRMRGSEGHAAKIRRNDVKSGLGGRRHSSRRSVLVTPARGGQSSYPSLFLPLLSTVHQLLLPFSPSTTVSRFRALLTHRSETVSPRTAQGSIIAHRHSTSDEP